MGNWDRLLDSYSNKNVESDPTAKFFKQPSNDVGRAPASMQAPQIPVMSDETIKVMRKNKQDMDNQVLKTREAQQKEHQARQDRYRKELEAYESKVQDSIIDTKARIDKAKSRFESQNPLSATAAFIDSLRMGGGNQASLIEQQFQKSQGFQNPTQQDHMLEGLNQKVQAGNKSLAELKFRQLQQEDYKNKWKADRTDKATKKGKLIGATSLEGLGDLEANFSTLDPLLAEWSDSHGSATGYIDSGLNYAQSKIKGTNQNKYAITRMTRAQTIGTALEGGKLTDPDYFSKYMEFIPKSTDLKSEAEHKIKNLKAMFRWSYNTKLKTMKEAGYDIGNLKPLPGEEKVNPLMAGKQFRDLKGMPVATGGEKNPTPVYKDDMSEEELVRMHKLTYPEKWGGPQGAE